MNTSVLVYIYWLEPRSVDYFTISVPVKLVDHLECTGVVDNNLVHVVARL